MHAHAEPADRDIIIFVADRPGRYPVSDPLNPNIAAEVVVFR